MTQFAYHFAHFLKKRQKTPFHVYLHMEGEKSQFTVTFHVCLSRFSRFSQKNAFLAEFAQFAELAEFGQFGHFGLAKT